jgi:hypothetical protein
MAGSHTIKVWAIDPNTQALTLIGTRTITLARRTASARSLNMPAPPVAPVLVLQNKPSILAATDVTVAAGSVVRS